MLRLADKGCYPSVCGFLPCVEGVGVSGGQNIGDKHTMKIAEIFQKEVESGALRLTVVDGQTWYSTWTLAQVLGHGMVSVFKLVPSEFKGKAEITFEQKGESVTKNVSVLSEAGALIMLMRSRSEAGRVFRKWLATRVLPHHLAPSQEELAITGIKAKRKRKPRALRGRKSRWTKEQIIDLMADDSTWVASALAHAAHTELGMSRATFYRLLRGMAAGGVVKKKGGTWSAAAPTLIDPVAPEAIEAPAQEEAQ